MLNTANILTIIRLALVPVFGFSLAKQEYSSALMIFVFCGITDVIDGYIARKYDMITDFGKIADPLADKVLQITALIILTLQGILPEIIVIVAGVKEAVMGVGAIVLYKKNVVVQAKVFGKLATVVLFFAIIGFLLEEAGLYSCFSIETQAMISYGLDGLIFTAIGITLIAFFSYMIGFIRVIKKEC